MESISEKRRNRGRGNRHGSGIEEVMRETYVCGRDHSVACSTFLMMPRRVRFSSSFLLSWFLSFHEPLLSSILSLKEHGLDFLFSVIYIFCLQRMIVFRELLW